MATIDKTGDLAETGAAELLAALYQARTFGVVHFKGPAGESAFVTFSRGVAKHASGNVGDGDAAIKTIMSWAEGEYRFIEDVLPDAEDFPANVSAARAAALAKAAGEAEKIPALPILPAGKSAGAVTETTASDVLKKLAAAKFTGCLAVGPAERRRGALAFRAGAPAGTVLWHDGRFLTGDKGYNTFARLFDAEKVRAELFALDESAAAALAAGLTGTAAVSRMPAAALNIEEYLSWARAAKLTGVVSIVAGERSANILIAEGEVLGSVVTPGGKLKKELDDALALYYAPGATVAVFAASPNTLT